MDQFFDIVVIGGGHAGIEAAAAASRLGCSTVLVTMDVGAIGRLSCNPAIGGMAKGQLVREIDALGGAMGILADTAGIQFKMLGRSKGPAMWSPRAQMDKDLYPAAARAYLENLDNLQLLEASIKDVTIHAGRVQGVLLEDGGRLRCSAVILGAGTFLCGRMHAGEESTSGGRVGERSSEGLSGSLRQVGFETGRLKTGTPPRIACDSIAYEETEPDGGDVDPRPFSWRTASVSNQIDCFLTRTSSATHDLLREGFDRSPMFSGRIVGPGPRYCPSIEDKIHRFADKASHQLFLEPEGLNADTIYVNGFSTSLPKEVQERGIRSVAGLQNARITRYGYAVEYDYFPPYQLRRTLESKKIEGLYFAGQVNGTSGYEEAAAQGLMAGVNAALKVGGRDPFVLERSEAYIGVLIDDLVTLSAEEPYRMFTSRAEHRLLLRQDNADLRLTPIARQMSLVSDVQAQTAALKSERIARAEAALRTQRIEPHAIGLNGERSTLWALLRRPDSDLDQIMAAGDESLRQLLSDPAIREQVEINARYEGYIGRQRDEIAAVLAQAGKPIPASLDYDRIRSISSEGREKLSRFRPETIAQAARISGVTRSDLAVLLLYIR